MARDAVKVREDSPIVVLRLSEKRRERKRLKAAPDSFSMHSRSWARWELTWSRSPSHIGLKSTKSSTISCDTPRATQSSLLAMGSATGRSKGTTDVSQPRKCPCKRSYALRSESMQT